MKNRETMAYNKKGYILRAKMIQEIARQHYEPYHDSCYKMVWKRYIKDTFFISYGTFLKYLKVTDDPPRQDSNQLSLF